MIECGGPPNAMHGWDVTVEVRREGNTAGTYDVYYFNPNKKRFRSRAEVARHLDAWWAVAAAGRAGQQQHGSDANRTPRNSFADWIRACHPENGKARNPPSSTAAADDGASDSDVELADRRLYLEDSLHRRLWNGKVARDALGVPVGHVALSHDQQCVLAATLDSTLRLLDKASGQVLCEYAGHENTAFQVGACLSHDDSRVLGGSEDGALHVWGLVDAKPLGRVQCHRAPLVAVSSHPKGDALLTASHDGTCKMWRSGPEGSSGRASDRVI